MTQLESVEQAYKRLQNMSGKINEGILDYQNLPNIRGTVETRELVAVLLASNLVLRDLLDLSEQKDDTITKLFVQVQKLESELRKSKGDKK